MKDFVFAVTIRASKTFDPAFFEHNLFLALERMFDEGMITPMGDEETEVDSAVGIEFLTPST